jgi:hypothetical protein
MCIETIYFYSFLHFHVFLRLVEPEASRMLSAQCVMTDCTVPCDEYAPWTRNIPIGQTPSFPLGLFSCRCGMHDVECMSLSKVLAPPDSSPFPKPAPVGSVRVPATKVDFPPLWPCNETLWCREQFCLIIMSTSVCPPDIFPQADAAAPSKETEHRHAELATGELLPLCNTTGLTHLSWSSYPKR